MAPLNMQTLEYLKNAKIDFLKVKTAILINLARSLMKQTNFEIDFFQFYRCSTKLSRDSG